MDKSTDKFMTNVSPQLFHIIIRVHKKDSAFFYFQLEANDGMAFYSTIPHASHAQTRDIDLKGSLEFYPHILHLINTCQKKFPIEILTDTGK